MSGTTYTFCDDTYSDLHKDAYGFRPSSDNYRWWKTLTDDEKQVEWNRLIVALEATVEREKEEEKLAVADFEKKIISIMSVGAKTRQDAVKWLYDSMEDKYDFEYADWQLGLPYGTFKRELQGVSL